MLNTPPPITSTITTGSKVFHSKHKIEKAARGLGGTTENSYRFTYSMRLAIQCSKSSIGEEGLDFSDRRLRCFIFFVKEGRS
jgi:hypothetical protein